HRNLHPSPTRRSSDLQILAEAAEELEERTQYFAPRQSGESPEQFAKRMVGSAAMVYAHNDPVMSACHTARHSDIEIQEILERQRSEEHTSELQSRSDL